MVEKDLFKEIKHKHKGEQTENFVHEAVELGVGAIAVGVGTALLKGVK